MRYTTIIDISEIDAVWRSYSTRLVYLYMVLKCGYHDDDRDLFRMSIRDMSWRLHISVSSVRHALAVLSRHNLISQTSPGCYMVVKWVETPSITKRKTRKEKQQEDQAQIRQQEAARIERQRQQDVAYRDYLKAQDLSSYELRLQTLKKKADQGDQDALKKYQSLIKYQITQKK